MKKNIFLILSLVLIGNFSFGQSSDYKVVFDITSASPANQRQVVRNVELIKSTNPDAQIEVVVYGQALSLLQKDTSPFVEEIKKLVSQNGIAFNACHHSMERNKISTSQLITGVGVVPDGIYEIVKKQKEGWGYIKIAQ